MFYVEVGEAGAELHVSTCRNKQFFWNITTEGKKQLKTYLKRKWEVKVAGDLITVCLANRN